MALSSVVACLIVLAVVVGMPASARLFSFSQFKTRGAERGLQLTLGLDSIKHTPVQQAFEELEKELRTRRQAVGLPQTLGQTELGDGYQYARVHYSGDQSLAIFILTYSLNRAKTVLLATHLYRSTDYGVSFTRIDTQLGSSSSRTLILWPNFYVNPVNKNMVRKHICSCHVLIFTVGQCVFTLVCNVFDSGLHNYAVLKHVVGKSCSHAKLSLFANSVTNTFDQNL